MKKSAVKYLTSTSYCARGAWKHEAKNGLFRVNAMKNMGNKLDNYLRDKAMRFGDVMQNALSVGRFYAIGVAVLFLCPF